MRFHLIFRNRFTGEEKLFRRDQNGNYLSIDGYTITKKEAVSGWSFMRKKPCNSPVRPSLSKLSIKASKKYDEIVSLNKDGLMNNKEFERGFKACLDIFTGVSSDN